MRATAPEGNRWPPAPTTHDARAGRNARAKRRPQREAGGRRREQAGARASAAQRAARDGARAGPRPRRRRGPEPAWFLGSLVLWLPARRSALPREGNSAPRAGRTTTLTARAEALFAPTRAKRRAADGSPCPPRSIYRSGPSTSEAEGKRGGALAQAGGKGASARSRRYKGGPRHLSRTLTRFRFERRNLFC